MGLGFESDDSGVAGCVQGGCDVGVVDLSGSGFAPAWDVGDLDLTEMVDAAADELDEVSLADLWVV